MKAYLNQIEAAEYCGYSVDTFRRHLRQYPLPKYGPTENRYKTSDLDAWMEDPHKFKVIPFRKPEKLLSLAEQKAAVFGYGKTG